MRDGEYITHVELPQGHRDTERSTDASHDRPAEPVGSVPPAASRRRALQHHTLDSILQQSRVEVDEEPDPLAGHAKVVEQLRFEQRYRSLDALDFHHDEILDNQVDLILTEKSAFVERCNPFLTLVVKTC